MTNMLQTTLSAAHAYAGAKQSIAQSTAALHENDLIQLKRHLRLNEANGPSFLTHVLRHKVNSAKQYTGTAPQDVVIGGSRVIYTVDGAPAQSGLLIHRVRAGGHSGVIPVYSLLGATLIGMRVGQRAPVLRKDGTVTTLCVLGVTRHN